MTADQLWISSVPRFGVVRTVIVDGSFAARFDDLNGDGREIELSFFRFDAGQWEETASLDDTRMPEIGGRPIVLASGWDAHAVGRGRPGQRWQLEWIDGTRLVQADPDGWWIAFAEHDLTHGRFPEPRLRPAD